jgi:hypothetical protein
MPYVNQNSQSRMPAQPQVHAYACLSLTSIHMRIVASL